MLSTEPGAGHFIHMKFFLQRPEYLVTITPDLSFSSRQVAETIGSIWAGQVGNDISISNKSKIAGALLDYFRSEYERRSKRHAFYGDLGYGGRTVIEAAEIAVAYYAKLLQPRKLVPQAPKRWLNKIRPSHR
jgi:hypothetical protein